MRDTKILFFTPQIPHALYMQRIHSSAVVHAHAHVRHFDIHMSINIVTCMVGSKKGYFEYSSRARRFNIKMN